MLLFLIHSVLYTFQIVLLVLRWILLQVSLQFILPIIFFSIFEPFFVVLCITHLRFLFILVFLSLFCLIFSGNLCFSYLDSPQNVVFVFPPFGFLEFFEIFRGTHWYCYMQSCCCCVFSLCSSIMNLFGCEVLINFLFLVWSKIQNLSWIQFLAVFFRKVAFDPCSEAFF